MARELVWLTTDEARQYARSRSAALQNACKSRPNIEGVFGLARCMAENRAFITRQGNGKKGTVFVGYEQVLPDYRGMVLLDATADIDGLNELCPWRSPVQIPKATYERLDIVHVPSVAEGTLKQWLQTKEHRREYVRHILDTVRSQVAPGQKALLVCKLDIVNAPIEGWTENVRPFVAARTASSLGTLRVACCPSHIGAVTASVRTIGPKPMWSCCSMTITCRNTQTLRLPKA